eukprot:GEMP01002242.1.p1 GENE.GEMP01002242.1~~GEMP01002242.1.p1  ORF type:complete len:666 (+),score=115.74 GEMP01002242.1:2633-4630(+)
MQVSWPMLRRMNPYYNGVYCIQVLSQAWHHRDGALTDQALRDGALGPTSQSVASSSSVDIPPPVAIPGRKPPRSRLLLPEINTDLDAKPDFAVDDQTSPGLYRSSPSFVNIPTLPFNASQGRYKQQEFLNILDVHQAEDKQKCTENKQKRTYRFLDRSAPFEQSYGHTNFFKGTSRGTRAAVKSLYVYDWFHTFLNLRLRVQTTILFLCMLLLWIFFAALFLAIQDSCGLEMDSFLDAFYMTLSTMETIGYGAGDVSPENPSPWYFSQCGSGAVLLSVEVFVSTIFFVFATGLLSTRLGRPQARASAVVFSSKALVQFNKQGAPHLVFRVADLRRHQLIQGHLRCYCIKHNKEGGATTNNQYSGMQVYPMRLNQPSDALGGMLVLSTPQEVIHRIDAWSPLSPYFRPLELSPTKPNYVESNVEPLIRNVSGGIPQRMSDCDVGYRLGFSCEVCGDEFTSLDALLLHVKSEGRLRERKRSERNRHATYYPGTLVEPSATDLQEYWEQEGQSFEVVCICEGIEPFTSNSLQARHSYTSSHDISFDRRLKDCLYHASGNHVFDVSRFHQTVRRNTAKTESNMAPSSSKSRSPTYLNSLSPSNILAAIDDRVREGLFAAMSDDMGGDFIQTPSSVFKDRRDRRSPVADTSPASHDDGFWQSLPREHFTR